MRSEKAELCQYWANKAQTALNVAEMCLENEYFEDAVSRSYYAAFYAIKAVLALEESEFKGKSHKSINSHFNEVYVHEKKLFKTSISHDLGQLQKARETNDYGDFEFATREDAVEQLSRAKNIINAVDEYLRGLSLQIQDDAL